MILIVKTKVCNDNDNYNEEIKQVYFCYVYSVKMK